jgi:hypothetical protein
MTAGDNQFHELLAAEPLDLEAIGAWLDAADPDARNEAVLSLGKAQQIRLFAAAAGRGGLTLNAYVPESNSPLAEVIHEGRNSLAMFTRFQKRFCRQPDSAEQLGGYNEQAMKWATGPGYFVAYVNESDGEFHIDYTQLPEQKVEAWPPIRPQSVRLGRFVYSNMVDVMRRVSNHVTVGRAIKNGKETNNYFMLCRQDSA